MEKIWEQLISTPPIAWTLDDYGNAGSDTHSLVFVGSRRIRQRDRAIRRSFASCGGRARYGHHRHELGKERNRFALDKALAVGRVEVSRLQENVDAAKQAKDTEAAVNLGISTKRLLSTLDEAEKN